MKRTIVSIHFLTIILLLGIMLHAADQPRKKPGAEKTPVQLTKIKESKTVRMIPSEFDGLTPHVLLF